MFDGNFRKGVDRVITPVGAWINKWLHINANFLTLLGLSLSVGCMVFVARGSFYIGFAFFVCTGLSDLLDGPVAKAAGSTSIRGSFFDSLADRITDALILLGMSWHILKNTSQSETLVFLPIVILILIQILSYQRAKAESLSIQAKGGALMERAERFIVMGFGILFNAWLIQTLWVLLGLVILTNLQRFIKIMRGVKNSPQNLNPSPQPES